MRKPDDPHPPIAGTAPSSDAEEQQVDGAGDGVAMGTCALDPRLEHAAGERGHLVRHQNVRNPFDGDRWIQTLRHRERAARNQGSAENSIGIGQEVVLDDKQEWHGFS